MSRLGMTIKSGPRGLGRLPWVLGLAVALIAAAPHALAATADDLAKALNQELRTAERQMHNGQREESDATLKSAEAMLAELRAADPAHKNLASLESKYNRTRTALDKRMGITTKPASSRPLPPKPAVPAAAPAAVAPAAAPAAAPAKLPAGVSKRLRDINGALDRAESAVAEGDVKNARYALERVPSLFDEIDRMYGGQFSADHPEYAGTQSRYADAQAGIEAGAEAQAAAAADAERAAAAAEAEAQGWIDRFAPFITGSSLPADHEPEKQLIYPGAAYPEKVAAMQPIYEEAKALYAEFEQSGLMSDDMPWNLAEAANALKWSLDSYEQSAGSASAGYAEDAESNLDQALAQLAKPGWQDDPAAVPPMVSKDWQERIELQISNLETVAPAGDAKVAELRAKQAAMLEQDRANRAAWRERIRVRPEVYAGADLADVRAKAESVVAEEVPGAKILRVSVYQGDWKEESVIESTDTTNTAVRHRVTRMINAQVAAKSGGEVLLHTLHIAKDRQSDGGWTGLYGHVMHSDRMLEENVGK